MKIASKTLFRTVAVIVLGAGALASMAVMTGSNAFAGDDAKSVQWEYEGAEGPEFWGELAEEFSVCSAGAQQSPIDLKGPVDADFSALELDYQSSPLAIVNNGHTIQVNYAPGSTLTLDGQTYELLQFHFHDPSEHTVDGSAYPMEAHLVHKHEETGALAVVGFFLDEGNKNEVLQTIWDEIPAEAGPEVAVENVEIDVAALLPDNTEDYYRYFGSLTTPPCSEVVNWIVLKEPVQVSPEQVESFVAAVGENARPVQTVGRRFVLD